MATTARHGSGICTVYGCTSGPVAGGFCGEHALVGLSTGGPLNEDEIVERHDVLLIFRSRGGTRTKPRNLLRRAGNRRHPSERGTERLMRPELSVRDTTWG